MRWRLPWRRGTATCTGGQRAKEDAERQLREVRSRWSEVHEAARTLRAALESPTNGDPFIDAVRREFGGRT